jgi:hypothetical protein
MPSFVLTEVVFIIVASLAFLHAWTRPNNHPGGRRRHLHLYVFAIVGGCCSDLLFMHLPIVDNFWHAHATIMLTERLPLYILAVYASFLYIPLACVWRCGLPRVAEATLSGICTVAFYAPFDVVGIKFLWWTWHDSDTVVAERIVGVPVSSTMWVGVYSCMFALLFGIFLPSSHDTNMQNRSLLNDGTSLYNAVQHRRVPLCTISSLFRACSAALLSIPLMMVHMMMVQCLMGGALLPPPPPPTCAMLGLTLLAYGSLLLSSIADSASNSQCHEALLERAKLTSLATGGKSSHWLVLAVLLHYGSLLFVARYFDPTLSVSTGIHQTFGPCGVDTTDYAGQTCQKYVCDVLEHHDFTFSCGNRPPPKRNVEARWYTICGLPKDDMWVRHSSAYTLSGLCVFALLIGVRGIATTQPTKRS